MPEDIGTMIFKLSVCNMKTGEWLNQIQYIQEFPLWCGGNKSNQNHEVLGLISALATSCGAGCRRGSDLMLLWLWRRPAATAPIGLLAWEPLYATGVALKRKKKIQYIHSLYVVLTKFT